MFQCFHYFGDMSDLTSLGFINLHLLFLLLENSASTASDKIEWLESVRSLQQKCHEPGLLRNRQLHHIVANIRSSIITEKHNREILEIPENRRARESTLELTLGCVGERPDPIISAFHHLSCRCPKFHITLLRLYH
jgi:hypothetical protein